MKLLLLLFYFPALLLCSNVIAEPVVIHNSGNTIAMENPLGSAKQKLQNTPIPKPSITIRRVPVITTTMSPGKVSARIVKLPYLSPPLFIVGYDPLSVSWLKKHKKTLKDHGAMGIAINVQTEQQVIELQNAAGGIAIAPVPGTKIGRELSLEHYPALISRTLIEQ